MYKIVIDASVWIKYARIKKIEPLLNRFIIYNFIAITNNYLFSEIFNALIENKWMHKSQAVHIIDFIRKITFIDVEAAVYAISPDPKDNYLFDLAIQNNCAFIISDDTNLLKFKLKPIPVYSSIGF